MTLQDDEENAPPAGLSEPLATPAPRPVRGAVIAVLLTLAAAGGLFAGFSGIGPASADALLLTGSFDARSTGLTDVAVAISELGSTATMAVLALTVGAWCWHAGRRADAVLMVAAIAGSVGLFTGLKELLDRPRPPADGRLVDVGNESLPSGHATMAVAVVGAIVVLSWAGRALAARVAMVTAAVAWAVAVGLSRIYLGVHWFSDVVAGWLVGAAWLALCVTVWSWWRARLSAQIGAFE